MGNCFEHAIFSDVLRCPVLNADRSCLLILANLGPDGLLDGSAQPLEVLRNTVSTAALAAGYPGVTYHGRVVWLAACHLFVAVGALMGFLVHSGWMLHLLVVGA